MISLAGFDVSLPETNLRPAERLLLTTFPPPSSEKPDFSIALENFAISSREVEPMPAEVSAESLLLTLEHPNFCGQIDLQKRCGLLRRRGDEAFPLHVFLRLAAAALISAEGGLPLHAAGVMFGSSVVLFFGPSGAGKSTIARTLGKPTLSDELIRVSGTNAFASGFWGSLEPEKRNFIRGQHPIRAAIALEKSDSFMLQRCSPAEAFRRLLGVTLVPRAEWLWKPGLQTLQRFVAEIPVFTMKWSSRESPERELTRTLSLLSDS